MTDLAPELAEFRRRLLDFAWVCANLIRIRQKEGNESVPFVLNRVQRWVMWNVDDMRAQGKPIRLWILKGRQFGISTLFSAYLYWRARFFGEVCLQLPHKEAPGKKMFRKIEHMHERLDAAPIVHAGKPIELAEVVSHNIGTLYSFKNGGLVNRESAENEDAGVSETYQNAHLTEGPLWKNATHTMAGLLPTIGAYLGSLVAGEFTARGIGDYAHSTFEDARVGASPFRALFLPWHWHEEYARPKRDDDRPLTGEEKDYRAFVAERGYEYPLTEAGKLKAKFEGKRTDLLETFQVGAKLSIEQMLWRRDRIAEFKRDYDYWRREYPATPEEAFQSSGRRVIPPMVMDQMDRAKKPPLRKGEIVVRLVKGRPVPIFREDDHGGRLWQWERPVAGAYYVIDADVSSGVGLDDSAIHVLKLSKHRIEVVASWVGKERPHDVARLLARLGRAYRTGMTKFPRSNEIDPSSGKPSMLAPERNGFGEHVIHELTENLGYRNVYRHEAKGKDVDEIGHVYGFPTTRLTKMPMLQMLVQVCYDKYLVVPCERTLRQMRNLVYLDDDDRTAGAPQGAHDDAAMAVGIGAWVSMQRALVRRGPRNYTNLPKSSYDTPDEDFPVGA